MTQAQVLVPRDLGVTSAQILAPGNAPAAATILSQHRESTEIQFVKPVNFDRAADAILKGETLAAVGSVFNLVLAIGVFALKLAPTYAGTALMVLPALATLIYYRNNSAELSEPGQIASSKAETCLERAQKLSLAATVYGNLFSGALLAIAGVVGVDSQVGLTAFIAAIAVVGIAAFGFSQEARHSLVQSLIPDEPAR